MVTFHTHNKLSNKHGISRLPHTTPVDVKVLLSVLRSAAAWDWHIGRKNPKSPFNDRVRIEMFRLKEELAHDGCSIALIPDGENLNKNGVAEVVVNPSHYYGFGIINNTAFDLYPYLFYFDTSDLSIVPFYLSPAIHQSGIDAPLPRNGYLTIGYGSSVGSAPLEFTLQGGQTWDVGIVKLFMATTPINLDRVAQESPFFVDGRVDECTASLKSWLANVGFWDTQYIGLTQPKTQTFLTTDSSDEISVSRPLSSTSAASSPQTSGEQPRMDPMVYYPDAGDNPLQSPHADVPHGEITSFMTVEELIMCLGNRGCTDITEQLNVDSCTTYPLFGGGFGDIYRGKLKNGAEVAIKTMRLYLTSSGGDKKRLNVSPEFDICDENLNYSSALPESYIRGGDLITPTLQNY
ncbi:hypothetical protein FRC06_009057 [Ceratobasidium sp. 370]|nr:hypothetical protein FRC06_009057 [Ceratobasidium sp. 370]